MRVGIAGVGVLAPGLAGWPATAAILRGESPYTEAPIQEGAAVPATLRRRTSIATRIAIAATLEAVAMSGIDAKQLASVFGSATGSGAEVAHMLVALAQPDLAVSPTHFHNSVHNSAVGYWCITSGSQLPSTSVTSHDDTFVAALLKAAAQVVEEGQATILTVFDAPFPEPLHRSRPIGAPVAVAFVLVPGDSSVTMDVGLAWGTAPALDVVPSLVPMATSNPAARALPLLQAIARRSPRVALPYLDRGQMSASLWYR